MPPTTVGQNLRKLLFPFRVLAPALLFLVATAFPISQPVAGRPQMTFPPTTRSTYLRSGNIASSRQAMLRPPSVSWVSFGDRHKLNRWTRLSTFRRNCSSAVFGR
jgi:hypothetical protein